MAANGDECSMVALDNSSPNRVAFPKCQEARSSKSGDAIYRGIRYDGRYGYMQSRQVHVLCFLNCKNSDPGLRKTLQNGSEPVTDQHVPGTSK